jgi:hypothetical protein
MNTNPSLEHVLDRVSMTHMYVRPACAVGGVASPLLQVDR